MLKAESHDNRGRVLVSLFELFGNFGFKGIQKTDRVEIGIDAES